MPRRTETVAPAETAPAETAPESVAYRSTRGCGTHSDNGRWMCTRHVTDETGSWHVAGESFERDTQEHHRWPVPAAEAHTLYCRAGGHRVEADDTCLECSPVRCSEHCLAQVCVACGQDSHSLRVYADEYYCYHCHRDTFTACVECGEVIERTSGRRCGACDNRPHILGYNTHALDVTTTHHALPAGVYRTFGAEIEVVFRSRADKDAALRALADPALDGKWVAKRDGSLPDGTGVEFVSGVMTLDGLRQAVRDLFRVADLAARIRQDDSCGTHVHVGRRGITPLATTRLHRTFSQAHDGDRRTARFLAALVGRYGNHFCAWDANRPVYMRYDLMWRNRRYASVRSLALNYNHYAAVSVSSHYPTVEVRAFAGATDPERIVSYIEATDLFADMFGAVADPVARDATDHYYALQDGICARLARYPALAARFADSADLGPYRVDTEYLDAVPRPGIDVPAKVRATFGTWAPLGFPSAMAEERPGDRDDDHDDDEGDLYDPDYDDEGDN